MALRRPTGRHGGVGVTSPQTPDRAAERITGSGNPPTGRDSYRGPSGRHDLLSVLPRIVGDLSFGRAVEVAERIELQQAIRIVCERNVSHASLCVDIPGRVHECGYETRMRGSVLVRPTGETVGGDAA